MNKFITIYFVGITTFIAICLGILAYPVMTGENLRNAYSANHGFYCGNALYNFDWGGTEQGMSFWALKAKESCGFDPTTAKRF
ncbi:MAG: hypothetical protein KC447_04490 [Rhodobacteraceae bacterium]|nr:hypothetical protein [Paracoccaceae bacterium]